MGAALEWRATYEGYLGGDSLEEVWSQNFWMTHLALEF